MTWHIGLEEGVKAFLTFFDEDYLADQDVFDCPVTDIRKTKVVSTWFEGSEVYSRNAK